MQERITSNFKKCMALADKCDDLKGFQDLMNNKIEKMSLQLIKFKELFTEKLNEFRTSFEDKLKLLHDELETEVSEFGVQVENSKKLCKELINLSKESIESSVEHQTEQMKEHLGMVLHTFEILTF